MKKVLCIALCLMFIMSNITTAFALENDYENNWAKNEIEYMKNRGIVSGYPDGSFKPANNMSKAEFYKVINKIMGFTQKSEINFNDVVTDNWYYNDVAKGVAAGYIIPAESLEAGKNISRGEVARIIGIVFSIEGDKQEANNFTDSNTIPEQLKAAIGGLKKNGYINGYPDGSIRVNAEITRAEVVKMLCNIAGEIINEKGIVNSNAEKNLVVNIAGVTLKDMEIGRSLYLTEGIGEGDVFLENVKVKSSTIINGGGANSLNIKNSELKSLLLDKKQNLLNVVLTNTKIETAKNANQTRLQLSQGSIIKNLELKDKAELVLEKGALIERLILIGADISINAQGSVNYLKSDAKFKVNGEQANANTEYKIVDGKLMLLNPVVSSGGTTWVYTPPTVVEYTVTFRLAGGTLDGKTDDKLAKVISGYAVVKPLDPIRDEYDFAGWLEDNHEAIFNFSTLITKNITLTATWIPKQAEPEKVDKTALAAAIAEAIAKDADDYTEESWTIFADVRKEAIAVNVDENATQAQVDLALTSLTTAMDSLVEKPVIDKVVLAAAIATAQSKVANDYTPESWIGFALALQQAIDVNGDVEATQTEVNTALESLTLAMNALVKKPVGPTPTIIAKYQPAFMPDFSYIYVEVENLQNAAKFRVVYYTYDLNGLPKLTESKICNINEKAGVIYYNPSEFESIAIKIYDQNENLLYTFEGVIPTLYGEVPPVVDKTALAEAIAIAQTKVADNYTPETWAPFAEALQAAITVNNNANATQNEVNTAKTNLNNAMANLVLKPAPAPTIVAKYRVAFLSTVHISITVTNIIEANKFDVVFKYVDNTVGTSEKVYINAESGGIWYNPTNGHKTITIRIYDINNNIIHIFENVTPIKGN